MLTSFANIGRYKKWGLDASIELPITSSLDFSVNGSLYYVMVKNERFAQSEANKGIEGLIYSYLTYKWKTFEFMAT
ncbi:hypothetical protein GNY06_10975 [Elizabethkingia argentiflava]|uniref:Uncharacterized protein n=1 Tax=Elizabethkingia argenteiflava TaxID=2681556 RepID=A0A845PXB3_9FLAO|nr:hypothetical protein [Elizabethkingia argenteiflava]